MGVSEAVFTEIFKREMKRANGNVGKALENAKFTLARHRRGIRRMESFLASAIDQPGTLANDQLVQESLDLPMDVIGGKHLG